ncbi:redoxin domain-containing protein [Pseudactinotalea sp. HY160]|uniref:TlpA family protein disulfide reductase n=1 Tax=Pseudactinotalea sp. HY160 TaxID=2654490 RepID=UPI00128E70E4|nr:TlpA disulfide reductase family protein [Pseudactinotalea sp. HY160]MPV50479.1 redoxin domain-containing protein [Pseudactinotalea sp. HY160]
MIRTPRRPLSTRQAPVTTPPAPARNHAAAAPVPVLVLLLAVALLVLAGCSSGPSAAEAADAGYVNGDGTVRTWPPEKRGEIVELAGETMAGDPVDIADWRGRPVVLNFWYAECPPCRKEAPDLAALATEYEDSVEFLGVNHTNEPATAQAFERRFELPYPSLYDKQAAGVAAVQGVVPLAAMPSTVVLDPQGRVAARIIGLADKSTLASLIDDALAEVDGAQ